MTSLRAKLALGFGGLLAILLAVSLLSVIVLNSYSHTLERFFRENYNSAIYCDRMKDALDALDSRAQGIVWGDAEITQKIAEAAQMRQFQSNLDLQLANCTLPGELELSRRLDAGSGRNYRRSYPASSTPPMETPATFIAARSFRNISPRDRSPSGSRTP